MSASGQDGKPLRNPLRSERDAFRVLVYIVVAALLIVLAATLVGTWAGVVLALVALVLGLTQTVSWLAAMLSTPEDFQGDDGGRSGDEER